MRHWLELEMLGRTAKTAEQIELLRRITPAGKAPAPWACVALLQSNESSLNDMRPLRGWLQAQPPQFRAQDLARALAARCGLPEAYLCAAGQPQPVEAMPAPVLYRYAIHHLK